MGGTADAITSRPLDAGSVPAKPQTAPAAVGGAGWRILKFFTALALIPICVGLTLGAHDHFLSAWAHLNFTIHGPGLMLKWLAIGAASFIGLVVLIWRPMLLYIFGHEITHALATWLCLGKISNLSASTTGGQITTSKSNTFIRLAPYSVPLYALLIVLLYYALNSWWRPLDDYTHWLAFGLGFLYTFHVGFSLWSLRRNQPDLKTDGWLFSLTLIYLANLFVFVMLLTFVMERNIQDVGLAVKDVCVLGWQHTVHIYQNLRGMLK
ncbi:MAG: hypothetical protein V1899_02180 [Planctomycetota bacterium]